MRLSWNEIRVRAAQFADEWKDAHYEKGETHAFYIAFFNVFGINPRRIANFEDPVKKLDGNHGFIDLFWKGVLLVEQKSAGGNLIKAKTQALDYFPGIKENDLPRYILVSDFQTFELHDLDENSSISFKLSELPKYIERFGFILGVEKRVFRDQDPVNIKASELMGKLHDTLKASGYDGHELERFLVRLLFCLFADDTGIFEPREIFYDLLTQRTREDGSDTGAWLSQLFDVLNTPIDKRQKNLDEDLREFPYVNGELFKERLRIPAFDSKMRKQLIEVCDFSWDAISPAIFGSLFQSVMTAGERRASGAHYTTEKNILKVIQPLFLDGLRSEFEQLKKRKDSGRKNALHGFHEKLSKLTFFDPACGCGNFLIIAYRELRELEIELLREINPKDQKTFLDVALLSRIDVNQFFGIEIGEFPVRIAEVAMWMMDHIMNNKLSLEFGDHFARIPLKASPQVVHGDALELDWSTVLPPGKCSYVLGNPPFIGAKYQDEKQREQVRRIAQLGGTGGTLDYVTAWFLKGGGYVQNTSAQIGFVATNSITQGEQVAQLWPVLFNRYGLEISFAHRTFAWGSDARGKAHVHVVIIGLTLAVHQPVNKRLFNYDDINGDPVESQHKVLSPYLFDAGQLTNRHLVVDETSESLSGSPKLIIGSKPIDGGHYIFDGEQTREFLKNESGAKKYLHPYVGAEEYINGGDRSILYLEEADPADLRRMPKVMERIAAVKAERLSSKSKPTQKLAMTPTKYHVTVVPKTPFLCVPEVSSERRDYVPIGWLEPPTIPSNLVRVMQGGTLWHFGILTSRMHMAWLRNIGGRLKSDYRYSIGIVYNPFPWPLSVDEKTKEKISTLANQILAARKKYPNSTLADLYDPNSMPNDLRKAHAALDEAVDKLYRKEKFQSDRERVEHLFAEYEKLVMPLTNTGGGKIKKSGKPKATK